MFSDFSVIDVLDKTDALSLVLRELDPFVNEGSFDSDIGKKLKIVAKLMKLKGSTHHSSLCKQRCVSDS